MTQSYLGDNLYTLRKKKGISQDEFAEGLGVSRQAVSKWERNEAYPDTENLIAISRFFDVSIDDLINKPIDNSKKPALTAEVPDIEDDDDENDNDYDDDDVDYDDDDDDDNNKKSKGKSKSHYRIWYSVPYPIVITIAYLLWGFLTPDGWQLGWTLYVTIPVYYSLITCIRRRKFSPFAYPVFITFIFLLFGMIWNIWHPLWIIYLTIPVYYPIASAIDRAIHN